MGLILDTSVLIADERGKFEMADFLRANAVGEILIAAITASELLHGVERASAEDRKAKRSAHVEETLKRLPIVAFDLPQARVHARIWAELMSKGISISPHDLLIAATAMAGGHSVATLNAGEFKRVPGLSVIDAVSFKHG